MIKKIMAFLGCLTLVSCATHRHQPKLITLKPTKSLILGLDGISYDMMLKLRNGGYFRSFKSPAPMIASFPSISDPNWARMVGAPITFSYTKEYFDMSANNGQGRHVGSLIDHVINPPPYESYFDFKPEGPLQHLASMAWSETTAFYWLDSLEKELLASDPKKSIFSAFIPNTDIIAHTKGEKELMEFLVELDRRTKLISERYKQKFSHDLEIIILSDHGNRFLRAQPIDLNSVLENKGWKLSNQLQDKNSVVTVTPEILSFGVFYCKSGVKNKLAQDLSFAEGVHVTMTSPRKNVIDIWADQAKNHTQIVVNSKEKSLTYHVLKGHDPLNQIEYFKSKKTLSFKEYFNLSYDDPYSYALVRIWEAFHINSEQPASVLVSPIEGYAFANKTLEVITKVMGLTSIHGSLLKEETQGVIISTHREFEALTPDGVFHTLFKRN